MGCGDRRRDFLKSAEVLGSFVPICFNCGGRLARLSRVPSTLAQVRIALDRERRVDERRLGRMDTRVYKIDRRRKNRRASRLPDDAFLSIDDDMILEIHDIAAERGQRPSEMTRIHRKPTANYRPPPSGFSSSS